jgi:hypothetical protein
VCWTCNLNAPTAASNPHGNCRRLHSAVERSRGVESKSCTNRYHEDDETPGEVVIKVQDILDLDWSTSQSLHLGDMDYSPALVITTTKTGKAYTDTVHVISHTQALCTDQFDSAPSQQLHRSGGWSCKVWLTDSKDQNAISPY